MMRTLMLSVLAFGALTTAATAEPVVLTDEQLDKVTAGGYHVVFTPGNQHGVASPGPATTLTTVENSACSGPAGRCIFPGTTTVITPGTVQTKEHNGAGHTTVISK